MKLRTKHVTCEGCGKGLNQVEAIWLYPETDELLCEGCQGRRAAEERR